MQVLDMSEGILRTISIDWRPWSVQLQVLESPGRVKDKSSDAPTDRMLRNMVYHGVSALPSTLGFHSTPLIKPLPIPPQKKNDITPPHAILRTTPTSSHIPPPRASG